MIMEQVEYPGMSGTNTMCVVTVLLETGMLPMTRAGHRADARGAGRADPRARRLRATARSPASRSATCRRSRRTSDAPVEVPHAGHGRRSTSPTAACSTSSPTPSRFGLRLTPGRRRRHRPHHRDDQGGRQRAAAGRPPGAARVRGDHDRPAVRAAARSGEQPAQRRHRLDRDARLGPARDLDRRDRPLAVRDRDLGPDGDAPRQGRAGRRRRRSATRASSARCSRAGCSRRRAVGPYRAIVPTHHRPGLDHRLRDYVVDPTDPFPDGFTIGDIWA